MQRHKNAIEQRRFASAAQASDHMALDEAAVYRAISTAADAGLLVKSMDGRILWANDA